MLELLIQLVLIDDDHHNSQLFILVALHDNFLLFPGLLTFFGLSHFWVHSGHPLSHSFTLLLTILLKNILKAHI